MHLLGFINESHYFNRVKLFHKQHAELDEENVMENACFLVIQAPALLTFVEASFWSIVVRRPRLQRRPTEPASSQTAIFMVFHGDFLDRGA